MPNSQQELIQKLHHIIKDYRAGDGCQPRTPDAIEQWLQQFPKADREPLLAGLVHVFGKTYISKIQLQKLLLGIAHHSYAPELSAVNFWQEANLTIPQKGGHSQRDILGLFDETLKEAHGFNLSSTGKSDDLFVYLDDCIATGSTIKRDLIDWVEEEAPKKAEVHVIAPIYYKGAFWIEEQIQTKAETIGKSVNLHIWSLSDYSLENRLYYKDRSDVLWPTSLPKSEAVKAYCEHLVTKGYPAKLRNGGNTGQAKLFATDTQRQLLERILLERSCIIRAEQTNLGKRFHPLGFHKLDCLGFGSLFLTYRNCPNNLPLAFWAKQKDYPELFPRTSHSESSTTDSFEEEF